MKAIKPAVLSAADSAKVELFGGIVTKKWRNISAKLNWRKMSAAEYRRRKTWRNYSAAESADGGLSPRNKVRVRVRVRIRVRVRTKFAADFVNGGLIL